MLLANKNQVILKNGETIFSKACYVHCTMFHKKWITMKIDSAVPFHLSWIDVYFFDEVVDF